LIEISGYIGALFIGIILGLTGGGGSILTVPILVYVLAINPVTATAYSLFIVGTTSSFGATQNYLKGLVEVKTGFLFAIPSFTAVFLTRKFIIPKIPDVIFTTNFFTLTKETFLMLFFAIIMVFAAIAMLKKKKETNIENKKNSLTNSIIQNAVIGVIIGLVGAGGGFLIIPSLVIFVQFHNVIVFNIKSKLLCFAKLHKEV